MDQRLHWNHPTSSSLKIKNKTLIATMSAEDHDHRAMIPTTLGKELMILNDDRNLGIRKLLDPDDFEEL